MGVIVFAFFADEFFDEVVVGRLVSRLGAHDCGFKAEAEADCYAFVEGSGQGEGVFVVVEFGQEAEGSEGEGKDGRDDALEEP